MLKWRFADEFHGVVCTQESLSKSFENELVEDMLSLITVFSAKLYGKRRGKKK